MESVKVGSHLIMIEAQFAEVDLSNAHVGGVLTMNKGTFTGTLSLNSVKVGSHLGMENAQFTEVDLSNAHVQGSLGMSSSTFTGPLTMDRFTCQQPSHDEQGSVC